MDRRENQSGNRDFGEKGESLGEQAQGSGGDSESTSETASNVKAEWKYQKEFPIQGRMREVVKSAIEATKAELAKNRKKLRKLQYGG
jgi:hypothetical protein